MRVELLQKQAAAARIKGVVGRIGSTIPIVPKPTQIKPATSHSALVTLCLFFSHSAVPEDFTLSISHHP